jgi:hypothetical protein
MAAITAGFSRPAKGCHPGSARSIPLQIVFISPGKGAIALIRIKEGA